MKRLTLNYGKRIAMVLLGGVALLSACKKDRLPAIDPKPSETAGMYVLCEGLYSSASGSSNSSITYFDLATSIPVNDYFKKQNGTDLGVNASDLKQYGSKMYCVITGTTAADKNSYVEVMRIADGKSVKRIAFSDAAGGFLPRYIAFHKGKAYVSGYDGYISKIDTASLSIEARIKVGGALEQLAIVNDKLYVTNSAHFQFGTDNNSSVSVVNLSNFNKMTEIPVGFNPTKIAATNAGDLFVVTKGNYVDIDPSLDKISSVSDSKLLSVPANIAAINITADKGFAILEGATWSDPFTFKVFNTSTGMMGNSFISDATAITGFYGVTVNTLNNDVLVADANGYAAAGNVYCFGENGKKKFQFATAALPQSIVFKYSYK